MQSHFASVFILLIFLTCALASSPLASDNLAKRDGGTLNYDLSLVADLRVKIEAIIPLFVNLDVNADISVFIGQIVVLVNACTTALVAIGAVVDLSDRAQITAIATIVANIIVVIQAAVCPFFNILANVKAVVVLDVALEAWLIQLNVCIRGIIVIIAPLCVQMLNCLNLRLRIVVTLLGLA